jgi:putative ABC transport system permease protein
MAEVMARGLLVVLSGVFAGVMLSYWGRGLLSHLLFEVSAQEPFAYAAAASLLALVGACACYFPARRATRVEPLEALRSEGARGSS